MRLAAPFRRSWTSGRWLALWVAAEVLLFLLLAEWFGFGRVIVAQIASTLVGLALLRRLGRSLPAPKGRGPLPPETGAAALAGSGLSALLFAMPGFLTTVAGLLLLAPFVRRRLNRKVEAWLRGALSRTPGMRGDTIDLDAGEWKAAPEEDGGDPAPPRLEQR